jgi:hypothetical protein
MHIMQVKRISLLRTYLSEDKHYVKLESDSRTSSEGVVLFFSTWLHLDANVLKRSKLTAYLSCA